MKIFDTHCDTVYKMYKHTITFDNDQTHVSKSQTDNYDKYEQMFAIWSNPSRTDEENWIQYQKTRDYFYENLTPLKSSKFIPYLSVEGGALLANDITRVEQLKNDGVRMMTLVWKDTCCIGGAHNTNLGLTPFGKSVVEELCRKNIIPDISHASDKMAYETFEIASSLGFSVCASHSNLRSVRNHTRNMTDDMFSEIIKLGGLSGLNLCCEHLEDIDLRIANMTSIIRHIEHYLELGGQNSLCLGCDFDGIKSLPEPYTGASSHIALYNELVKLNYSEELINKIFYQNAKNFFENIDNV